MDRLTERDISFDGTSFAQIKTSNSLCSEICREHKAGCRGCPIETALERLAQYEDIGLTPEQLLQVDKMYTDRCREIAELEGRRLENKLKNCPFCGGKAFFKTSTTSSSHLGVCFRFDIACKDCGASPHGIYNVEFGLTDSGGIKPLRDDRKRAVEEWNKRA